MGHNTELVSIIQMISPFGVIENIIKEEQKKYKEEIVVEVKPIENFYKAKDYHQDYLKKNPNGYCHINLE